MSARRIFTLPARHRADSDPMDLMAVALGLIIFAVLLALIEGLDRV